MPSKSPRIAARAIIVHDNKLLLVNAWAAQKSPLMCAPGGGAHVGSSLPENLAREVYEETGLRVIVGAPALVNEFHAPKTGFHQVEVFFRCVIDGSIEISPDWKDTDAVVNRHIWVTKDELSDVFHKPSSLGDVAFDPNCALRYDPLEQIVS
jgi:8-oxo-dGTP pyrophosphatase MutT (NUDIX family)